MVLSGFLLAVHWTLCVKLLSTHTYSDPLFRSVIRSPRYCALDPSGHALLPGRTNTAALLGRKHKVQGSIDSLPPTSVNMTGVIVVTWDSGIGPKSSEKEKSGVVEMQRRLPILPLPTTANPLYNIAALDTQALTPQ